MTDKIFINIYTKIRKFLLGIWICIVIASLLKIDFIVLFGTFLILIISLALILSKYFIGGEKNDNYLF